MSGCCVVKRLSKIGGREADPLLEKQVSDWLEVVTCLPREKRDFHHWLRSGELLCVLANEIHKNSIKKVNTFKFQTSHLLSDSISPIAAFQMRENISLFIRFCRDVCGLPEKDLFSTDDLFDRKDLKAVVLTLWNLGGYVQSERPDLPPLGLAQNAASHANSPYRRGVPRSPLVAPPEPLRAPRPPQTSVALHYPHELASSPEKPRPAAPGAPVFLAEDCGGLEEAVRMWLEAVLGERKPAEYSVEEWLQSGEVLCLAFNALEVEGQSGLIEGVVGKRQDRAEQGSQRSASGNAQIAFRERENITKFIRACRAVGVRESDLFTSVDLYEGKNFHACLNTVYALGGVLQSVFNNKQRSHSVCSAVMKPRLGKKQLPANASKSAKSATSTQ